MIYCQAESLGGASAFTSARRNPDVEFLQNKPNKVFGFMGLIILRCQFDPLPTALRRSLPARCESEALENFPSAFFTVNHPYHFRGTTPPFTLTPRFGVGGYEEWDGPSSTR